MPWTRTSDDYADECWDLSSDAYRTHHEGLTWANRKLTDCTVKKTDVVRAVKFPDAVAELLACGFWTDEGDHYRIRHQAAYQRTREEVLRMQESRRANGAKGGRPRKLAREASKPSSYPSSEATTEPRGSGQVWSGTEHLQTNPRLEEKVTSACRQGDVVDLATDQVMVDEDDYLRSLGVCHRCGGQGCSDCVGSMEWSA